MRLERLPELIAEIEDGVRSLERLIGELVQTADAIPGSEARQVYTESAALKLHNFYTGCERIFEGIATDLNGGLPQQHDRHRRLLNSMRLEIEGVRPAVLRDRTTADLREFLAFRHLVRNIYGYELDSDRVVELCDRAREVHPRVRADLLGFVKFLRGLSQGTT